MPAFAQMTLLGQSFQTALPLDLFDRVHRVRSRYAAALLAASVGDYEHAQELRSLSRYLGHLLARQARLTPEQRGGVRMLDISLAVDGFFPELRGWTQYELAQSHRRRLLARDRAS
jgi:hypothetical protein